VRTVTGRAGLEPSDGPILVTVGVFDGLHLGHQYLLRELRDAAAAHGARPTVITFDHHPDEVLVGNAPALLCDPSDRLEMLEAAGIEVTVIQHFDVELRQTPFDVFIRRIADRVDLAGFLMTPESAFGYERGGTAETVAALGNELGYDVAVVPAFELRGHPVSSSEIRRAIREGDLRTAARLLGRPYAVVGLTSRASRDPVLTFRMPVALPPAGLYAAQIEDIDEGVRHGVNHAHVVPGGIRLDGIWIGGPRLRLTFEPAET